ncbi:MAG TPA: hypothetical protein VG270_12140, partial [Pseudolabrys sp.]|nr:hypothetical protein [Pseudolabrys sp.]
MMKTLMIGAALATMIGAPAMAQSWNPSVGSGNIVGAYDHPYSGPTIPRSSEGYSSYGSGYGGAYAFVPER